MSLVAELRRRNVLRMALLYLGTAWLVLQVVDLLIDRGPLPESLGPITLAVLVIGFPIALLLAWFYELTPEGIQVDADGEVAGQTDGFYGRRVDFVIIAVLAAAVVVFAYDKWVLAPSRDADLAKTMTEAVIGQMAEFDDETVVAKSVAVLPFINLSNDAEQEYFADGLAEEILYVLSRVPGLAVASRASAFAYKGDRRAISQIARELGVNFVLIGSVRRAENRVRIFAELISVGNDEQLWSNIFEAEISDVFAIQQEIAFAIGRKLETQLVDPRGNPVIVSGTTSVSAHNAFLKGRYLLHKRGEENVQRAISYFEKATELDDGYAQAYAALAYAKTIGWGQVDREGAKRSAARAVELDPNLPMAWIAAARSAMYEFKYVEAESFLRKALALEPRNAAAWHTLASLMSRFRGAKDALEPELKAVSLDPASSIYRAWLGIHYIALGRFDEGMVHVDAAMEMDIGMFAPSMVWKAATGDIDGALAVLVRAQKEVGLSEDAFAWYRAFIYVAEGRLEDARAAVAGRDEPQPRNPTIEVTVISAIGDIDRANDILEATCAERFPSKELVALAQHMPNNRINETRYRECGEKVGLTTPSDAGHNDR